MLVDKPLKGDGLKTMQNKHNGNPYHTRGWIDVFWSEMKGVWEKNTTILNILQCIFII